MVYLTKQYKFCAAHQYWNESWTERENDEVFGEDVRVHGHNYVLSITVKGNINKMFDEKNQEQVVEETLETSEIQNVEKASADNASTTTADNVAEIADYLKPELFHKHNSTILFRIFMV